MTSSQTTVGAQHLERPKVLRIAVLLMYAGAGLTLLGTMADVIALAVSGSAGLRSAHPHATAAQLHATSGTLMTSVIFAGLIEAALWFFMARANRSGVSWARIFATVLLVVNTVVTVTGFAGSSTVTSKIFAALIWLVGVAAVWYLWQRESSAYFRAPTAPTANPGRPSDSA